MKLSSDHRAINLGCSFNCSKQSRGVVHVTIAGREYQLVLADHSLVWPGHQTDDTKVDYEAVHGLLSASGSIEATLRLHLVGADPPPRSQSQSAAPAIHRVTPSVRTARAAGSIHNSAALLTREPRLKQWKGLSRPTIVHADWGADAKRWACVAQWDGAKYRLAPPVRIGSQTGAWLEQVTSYEAVVLGFDFVIGLPQAFRPDVTSSAAFLESAPAEFFQKAGSLDLVSPARPFFCGEGKKKQMAGRVLELSEADPTLLLRRCERRAPYRIGTAEVLFWCKFGKQVGSGTLRGWQEIIRPGRLKGVALWPFDGADLAHLLAERGKVIVETYPGDAYSVLGIRGNNKRSHSWRKAACDRIREVLAHQPIELAAELNAEFDEGFGEGPNGEDPFDTAVGALLLALVALGERSPGLPDDPVIQNKEGWIIGCDSE
ncbi:MAG TPA: hypothetical protein VEB21_06525 [Terriglobales bacterium]|nr:hypothetical protein [Terriglobales bacterium]